MVKPNSVIKLDLRPDTSNVTTRQSQTADFSFRSQPYRPNAALALLVFIAAYGLARAPQAFDIPLERAIDSYANVSPIIDRLFFDLDTYFTFSGTVLVALIWACWFASPIPERRARLIIGMIVSLIAAAISRSLQHLLATHPRPFYDPALGFHLPAVLGQTPLNTWDSFPSDHAAIFFGLAATIATLRPGLGLIAFLWLVLVEPSRSFLGAHYPSDLIAGGALGTSMVWAAQGSYAVKVGGRIANWERRSPMLFYFCAFFLSYEIATIFTDIRNLGGSGVSLISELHHLLH